MNPKLDRSAKLLMLLAHPTRIRIVLLLQQENSLNVTQLVNQLGVEQSLLSHNLVRMANQGLLSVIRRGKERYYSLADPVYAEIIQLLLTSSLFERVL